MDIVCAVLFDIWLYLVLKENLKTYKKGSRNGCLFCSKHINNYLKSNLSAFITLFQALTKSFTNLALASLLA